MLRKKIIRKWTSLCLLAIASALALTACAGGVSQQEYDAVKQQLAAKEQELKQQAEATKGTESSNKLSVWKVVPNAPPRPPPAPLPPGQTPPPPPQVPESYSNPLPLFFYVDTVTAGKGESKYNVDPSISCMISGVFKRGMHIVWRWEVVETSTGKKLTNNDMQRTMVRLPNGIEVDGRFGRHGATVDSPWFWTAAWDVPPDYPLGVLDFSVLATTKGGKTGTFKQLPVFVPGALESRLQIVE